MVDRRITDPVRIAQLLASEVEGRRAGPLGTVQVVDADRDATPASDGALAFRLSGPEGTLGAVTLYPEAAVLSLETRETGQDDEALAAGEAAANAHDRETVTVTREEDRLSVEIGSGAATKAALDVLRAVINARAQGSGDRG